MINVQPRNFRSKKFLSNFPLPVSFKGSKPKILINVLIDAIDIIHDNNGHNNEVKKCLRLMIVSQPCHLHSF